MVGTDRIFKEAEGNSGRLVLSKRKLSALLNAGDECWEKLALHV